MVKNLQEKNSSSLLLKAPGSGNTKFLKQTFFFPKYSSTFPTRQPLNHGGEDELLFAKNPSKYCHGFPHTFEYCLCVSTVRIHRHLANSGITAGGAPSSSSGMCVYVCVCACVPGGQGRGHPVATLSEQFLLCSLSWRFEVRVCDTSAFWHVLSSPFQPPPLTWSSVYTGCVQEAHRKWSLPTLFYTLFYFSPKNMRGPCLLKPGGGSYITRPIS